MLRDFAAGLTAVFTPQAVITQRQFLVFTTMLGLRNLNLLKKAGVETSDLFAPTPPAPATGPIVLRQ